MDFRDNYTRMLEEQWAPFNRSLCSKCGWADRWGETQCPPWRVREGFRDECDSFAPRQGTRVRSAANGHGGTVDRVDDAGVWVYWDGVATATCCDRAALAKEAP